MQKGAWEYDIVYPAYKNNMTDILAAMGLAQLRRYDSLLERRFGLIKLYEISLDNEKVRIIKHSGDNFKSSGHLLLCNLIGYSVEERNNIIIKLAENSISTNVHYKPLPMMTAYKKLGFSIDDYPNAYNMFSNEITLPLYSTLTNNEIEYISEQLNSLLNEGGIR